MGTERLIELVRQNKILYDSSNPNYSNIKMQNMVWDMIGIELNGHGKS